MEVLSYVPICLSSSSCFLISTLSLRLSFAWIRLGFWSPEYQKRTIAMMSGFTPLQEDCFSPQQAMQLVARTGEKKATIRIDKFIYNSVLAGALLGFGCAASLIVGASPWYAENAPGVESMLAGMVFPIGLILIALTGAELWTSTIMVRPTRASPQGVEKILSLNHILSHCTCSLTLGIVHHRRLARRPRHDPQHGENVGHIVHRQPRRHPLLPLRQLHLGWRFLLDVAAGVLRRVCRWQSAGADVVQHFLERYWRYDLPLSTLDMRRVESIIDIC